MASKEATKAEAKEAPKTEKASKKEAAAEEEFFAFEFTLPVAKIGEKTTNPQVKSKVGDAFLGYGRFTETQVSGAVGQDRTVTIFFAQLFGKGQPQWDSLKKNDKAIVKVYDEDVELRLSGNKPSGGGATTGTSSRPKKEAPKGTGRGRGRGEGRGDRRPRDGEKKDGDKKDGDKKEGEEKKEDGGRGRGRGRGGPKKEEGPKTSMQRGRANIGGKLGPVSKVRLAKQAKEARDKENAARAARGEAPLEDPKKAGEEPEPKKDDKKDAKKEAGKKGGDAKKEGGKKEAGKAEGGKKEAAKKAK